MRARRCHDTRMFSANADRLEPRPCKQYEKKMLLDAKFIAHVPSCEACQGVVAYLNRESEIKRYVYRTRN